MRDLQVNQSLNNSIEIYRTFGIQNEFRILVICKLKQQKFITLRSRLQNGCRGIDGRGDWKVLERGPQILLNSNSKSKFKIQYVLLSILQVLVDRIRALLHDISLNCQRFQKYHHCQEERTRRKQLGRKK